MVGSAFAANVLDDFSSSTLDSAWSFSDPVGNSNYSLTAFPGHLQITAPSGTSHDCWPGLGFDCPRMLRSAGNIDAVYETRIEGAALPSADRSTYGIMLYQDDSNYLRFEYRHQSSDNVEAYKVISNSGSGAIDSGPVSMSSGNYLRVVRSGSSYTLYYTTDGSSWNNAGTFSQPGFTVNKAGVYVINAGTNPATTGNFDYFSYNQTTGPVPICACGSLSSNTGYALTCDIANFAGGDCFTSNSQQNILFDCQGHTVDGTDQGGSHGFFISNSQNLTVKNCVVTDFERGIQLDRSSGNYLSNIIANSNSQYGVKLYPASSNNTLSHITVNNNNEGLAFYNNFDGSTATGSNNNVVSDVTASGNSDIGIYIYYSTGNSFTGVAATGNSKGIMLDSSPSNNFSSATSSGNSQAGLYAQSGSSGNRFLSSTFASNPGGIYFTSSGGNYFENNTNELSYTGTTQKFYSNSAQDISSRLNTGWFPLLAADGSAATSQDSTAWYNGTPGGKNADGSANSSLHYWYGNNGFAGDTTAPVVSIQVPVNNSILAISSTSLNYTVSDASPVTCWYVLDGSAIPLPSCWNTTIGHLTDGVHTITVFANDTANNTNSATVTFTVDTTAPAVSITSPANNSTVTTSNTPLNYTITDITPTTCWYSLDFGSAVSLPSCQNATIGPLGNGNHTITVYANDSGGNASNATVTFTVDVAIPDTTPPVVVIASPANNSTVTNSNVSLNYTVNDTSPVTCWYTLDGGTAAPLPSCANTILGPLSDGQHNVTVYANDTSGNVGNQSVTFIINTGPIPLTSCANLISNTAYVLMNDIVNATSTCFISNNQENISFNGQGHLVDGIDALDTYGFHVLNNSRNITIRNTQVADFHFGVNIDQSSLVSIYDFTALSNSHSGIMHSYSVSDTFSNVTSSNNTYNGIWCYYSNSSTYNGISASGNGNIGIVMTGCSGNSLSSATTNSNYYGLYLQESANRNTLTGLTSQGNSFGGMTLQLSSTQNSFSNSTISGNARYGIEIRGAPNNYFSNVSNELPYNGSSHKFFSDSAQNISSLLNTGWFPLLAANGSAATSQGNTAWYNGTAGGKNANGTANASLHYWYNNQDASGPSIVLLSPANGASSTDSNPTFSWNATDFSSDLTCSLYADASVNLGNLSVTSGSVYATSAASAFAVGAHSWYVNCSDPAGSSSVSDTRSFTVTSGGGGGGGGGGTGGSSKFKECPVDLGNGKICYVKVRREIESTSSLSTMTTTLFNLDGPGCNMEDFTFVDTIPSDFASFTELNFTPPYMARDGSKVGWQFPSFAGGESKVITYSVGRWLTPSKVNSFDICGQLSAKKQAPPANVTKNETKPPVRAESVPGRGKLWETTTPSGGGNVDGSLISASLFDDMLNLRGLWLFVCPIGLLLLLLLLFLLFYKRKECPRCKTMNSQWAKTCEKCGFRFSTKANAKVNDRKK